MKTEGSCQEHKVKRDVVMVMIMIMMVMTTMMMMVMMMMRLIDRTSYCILLQRTGSPE